MLGVFTAIGALAGATAAEAGGFAIREQSAYGQGMGFAGIAAGGSLSSMFWNPATLSSVEGLEAESVMSTAIPLIDTTYSAGLLAIPDTSDDIGIMAYIPPATRRRASTTSSSSGSA